MNLPQVVSPAEWETARGALLVKEKEATRARDALTAQRRRLPMVRVDKQYAFEGPDGEASLLDLFDGRRQLIVYHHMLKPGDDDPCSGCSLFIDNIGHLHSRDTSLVLVSRAPSAEIEALDAPGHSPKCGSPLEGDLPVAILALGVDSRRRVDELVDKALAAGGLPEQT